MGYPKEINVDWNHGCGARATDPCLTLYGVVSDGPKNVLGRRVLFRIRKTELISLATQRLAREDQSRWIEPEE